MRDPLLLVKKVSIHFCLKYTNIPKLIPTLCVNWGCVCLLCFEMKILYLSFGILLIFSCCKIIIAQEGNSKLFFLSFISDVPEDIIPLRAYQSICTCYDIRPILLDG